MSADPRDGRVRGDRQKTALTGLLEPVVAGTGHDLEEVSVSPAGKRRVVRVVVDADGGVDLDAIAEVSRAVSAALDEAEPLGGAPYVLEVTSPGVDRPLTEPRHWRRAAGRLVRFGTADGGTVEGRVLSADEEKIVLDVAGREETHPFSATGPGRVQVEFRRIEPDGTAGDALDEDEDEG